MILEVDGVPYENFKSATVEKRLDALSNTFSFVAAASKEEPFPFSGGESCKIRIDNEIAFTGNIEVISGNHSSREYLIQGRDKTGDFLDSSIGETFTLTGQISLKLVIEFIMDGIGLTGVSVIDNANPRPFTSAEDIESPELNDNAFEYVEALARKRQVILTSNSNGDIVIEKSPGSSIGGQLIYLNDSTLNNIIDGSFSYDQTGRFNVYKFASNLNPVASVNAGQTSVNSIIYQKGSITDQEIRAGRQLALISEGPFSSSENEKRAKWEANIRKARGKVYSATVLGYRATEGGELWDVNRLVQVNDDFANISTEMLINTVTFNYDVDNGSTTTLSLVNKKAYSLVLSEPKTETLGY